MMLEKIDVTSKVYARLAVRAGPYKSINATIEELLDFKEKYDADKTKLEAWINASEVPK